LLVKNPKVKFFIETITDFETVNFHNLDLFELPIENQLLLEQNDQFVEMIHDFDYFFRQKAKIISKEFREENKGKED
jgi:hypothetical protein